MAAMNTQGRSPESWDYESLRQYFDRAGRCSRSWEGFFTRATSMEPNSAPYVVLSDGLWRSRFGADPEVVGKTVQLDKHPFTVLAWLRRFPRVRAFDLAGLLVCRW